LENNYDNFCSLSKLDGRKLQRWTKERDVNMVYGLRNSNECQNPIIRQIEHFKEGKLEKASELYCGAKIFKK